LILYDQTAENLIDARPAGIKVRLETPQFVRPHERGVGIPIILSPWAQEFTRNE